MNHAPATTNLFFTPGMRMLIAMMLAGLAFELYLRWLGKHERRETEQEPLGIILCAGKKQELVELLELGQAGIHVAEYLTALPPRELLEQKLHSAIQSARQRIEALPASEETERDND